jgi:RNA-directed DNA polymerase
MTAVTTRAGAASHIDWHSIDWQKANINVRRLQARIVKAVKENRWGKVKALQHLLTHSFSGKAIAIKRVTENQGKRTPGVDGETWNTPIMKATALDSLKQRGYQPLPSRRIYIPKSNGKLRPLSIPAMADRAMQALYMLALMPIAETNADPNSYGFRPQRSTADAIEQCHIVLSKKGSANWILEGDISSCFDKISHHWLMENIPMDKTILRKWLQAGFIDRYIFYQTEEGTPQGSICSPVLARLTLDGLESKLRQQYPRNSVKARRAKVNLIVYADDFIITGSSKELLEKDVKPLVEEFLRERGLELSLEKTKITHIEDGFDFLGKNVRKYKNTILIKPSKKNIKNFLDKIRAIIKVNKQATTKNLILQLNAVIRGWVQYHRYGASKETFYKVDNAIFRALWQWAKRRHPKKPQKWVKEKYFYRINGRNWIFSTPEKLSLYYATNMPIKMHIKIKSAANPYDRKWEVYFEERSGLQMLDDLTERRKLLRLWFEQEGICTICLQKITKETGWNIHHLVRKVDGGKHTMNNLVLLHPNCHRQVHSQGLEVIKPRPFNRALREA